MDGRLLKLKELLSLLVPYFGVNHAKVYVALLGGEVKTAKQLAQETCMAKNKVYQTLNDLAEYGLVKVTNTHPTSYCSREPLKEIEKLVDKKIMLLEKLPLELDRVLESGGSCEKEYLIKFSERQTKLFDNKNKAIVIEAAEAKQIIQQLNSYVNKLEPKKEYGFAVYR